MTARLASHPDVAERTPDILERLVAVGVDVEFAGPEPGGPGAGDPLLALRDGAIDLALVSIGALRGSEADDLTTVAVLPRREVRDVLVTLSGRASPLSELAAGARVALEGARRAAFLAAHRPDVTAVALTHAEMVALVSETADWTGGDGTDPGREGDPSGEGHGIDAVVMSALEARHAGLVDETVEALDPRAWLPDPGQGAYALLARHPIAEATALDHLPTRTALRAELALLEALDVEPDSPLGCLAQPSGRWIRLWAAAVSADGRRLVRSDLTGPLDEPEGLGSAVARQLVERGFGLVVADAVS